MWVKGHFYINGIRYLFNAKVFEQGSEFGINGGRISKLWIVKDITINPWNYFVNCPVVNYDRGWDVEPRDENDIRALNYVLNLYK